MCEPTKTLKLCTCGEKIDKSKPYWTLPRKTIRQNDFQPLVMGMYMPPESADEDNKTQKKLWLETQLNSSNCFDFNYEPFSEDKLIIHLDDYKFSFVFSASTRNWQAQYTDNPFSPCIKRSVQAKGYLEL